MDELPQLTSAVAELLTTQGEHRLTDDQLLQLQLHLKLIPSWAARVPDSTSFRFVDWQPVLILPRKEGFTRNEIAIAAYLQPLHSQLCAFALQVLWKANQIARTLCQAFNEGHTIVVATMTRSLMETVAAFGCDSHRVNQIWKLRKKEPAPDVESLAAFDEEAREVVCQMLFGTRLKRDNVPVTGIERTNILTYIDKAERLSENPGIRRLYDVLCDAVHPSFGSNRCFWTKEPCKHSGPIYEFVTSRRSTGIPSDIPYSAAMGSLWALVWLGLMWNLLDTTLKDICLTARIYSLPTPYFGIVFPGDPSGYCVCGSGNQEQACCHEFGWESSREEDVM